MQDDAIVTADFMEGYRHVDAPDLRIEMADGGSLVSDNAVSVMVRPSPPGPSGPRRLTLAMVDRWFKIAFCVAAIFGFGFAAGLWEMNQEWHPVARGYRNEIVWLQDDAEKQKRESLERFNGFVVMARNEIIGRDMLLDAAAREVERLNAVNKWLQGKFQTSL